MRRIVTTTITACLFTISMQGQQPAAPASATPDPIRTLVSRLELDNYKATVKGLTQFGDRRQGTDRNRAATDWIEAQLKSYGCADIGRIKYDYNPPPPNPNANQTPRPPAD